MKIQKRQDTDFFGTKSGNTNAIAVGYATETTNYGEIATGILNKSTRGKHSNTPEGVVGDSEATLFSVGCGTSKGRKNALEVKGDGSVIISNGDTNINVADKIKEALAIENNIELVKSTDNDLQYTLMVNNTAKGEINIPKDQFLKNVVYDDTEKQLVFTFVTLDEDEHVEKVPVGDLKDIYTAGDNITIENNKISADLSTVMTAISNEKTQRETTDNEIKTTLDSKADLTAVQQMLSSKVDLDISDGTINIRGIQGVGFSPSDTIVFNTNKGVVDLSDYAKATDLNTNIKSLQDVLEGKADLDYVMLINQNSNGVGEHATIQTFDGNSYVNINFGIDGDDTYVRGINLDGNYGNVFINDCSVNINTDDNDPGSDGFFVRYGEQGETKSGSLTPYGVICEYLPQKDTEVLTTNGKSISLDDYAKSSTIPTKTSQLTNDSNFITTYTETDPVWTSEKGNYYTRTEIDDKGYLTEHQSLAEYAKKTDIPDVSTKADLVNGKMKAEQLPQLDNITEATTADEVVTKFNALLTDLKAKGFMTPDAEE